MENICKAYNIKVMKKIFFHSRSVQAFKHKTVCLTKLPELSEMYREQHREYGY